MFLRVLYRHTFSLKPSKTAGDTPCRQALAPLISDGPIILLVLLILTQTPDWLLRAFQIVGGLYIIYLAWGAYKTFQTPVSELSLDPVAPQKSLCEATILNLLNPNPYIF